MERRACFICRFIFLFVEVGPIKILGMRPVALVFVEILGL